MQPTRRINKTDEEYSELDEDVGDNPSEATLSSTMPDKNKLETNDLTKQTLEDELSTKENHALTEGNAQLDDRKGACNNEEPSTSGIPQSMIIPKKGQKRCVSSAVLTPESFSECESSDLNDWTGSDSLVNMRQAMDSTTREVEQKNRKQLRRAKTKSENLGKRDAYEDDEAKCGGCSDRDAKIFQLKTKKEKHKEENSILKQKNEKLIEQLNGRQETEKLWQHILMENKDLKHKNTQRDLEDKIRCLEENKRLAEKVCELKKENKDSLEYVIRERQKEKTAMNETIEKLQKENQTQAQKIVQLKQELEETKKNVVRENKTAMIQVVQKFQKEKEKLAKIVNDLEQKNQDSMRNIVRKRLEEKTATDKTIHKLQEEKQTKAQKIAELEQKLEETKKSVVHERQENETAMIQVVQKFQEETEKLVKIVNDLEQKAEQQTGELETVKAQVKKATDEREKARIQCNNLQRPNAVRRNRTGHFPRGLQASEGPVQASTDPAQVSEDRAQVCGDPAQASENPRRVKLRKRTRRLNPLKFFRRIHDEHVCDEDKGTNVEEGAGCRDSAC